jgi:hypothetical protein
MIRSMVFAALLSAASAVPAMAAAERFDYRVVHPTYGDIGTYTNIVDHVGNTTVVKTQMRIAVRILGIVVFREQADRTEHWRDQKLVGFDGVTVINGDSLPVHGEARDGVFVVTTRNGTVDAPPNVHPSNPWSPMVLHTDVMMSTKNGRVQPVQVTGGEIKRVTLPGVTLNLHQYEVVTDKHQFVWLDDRGTPVAFQTTEDGAPVDFVLSRRQQVAIQDP